MRDEDDHDDDDGPRAASAWMARYSRQIAFEPIGEAGQRRLATGAVAIIGCGGLGAAAASALVRAGVGLVRLVDRDRVELSNLHRQLLYDQDDLGRPKAQAAAQRLHRIDPANVALEARVVDVDEASVAKVVEGVELVVDATDNLPVRYLLNDACLARGLPWIYGGVSGASGMVLSVLAGVKRDAPCFCCVFPRGGAPDALAVSTPAVLGPVPAVVGALQAVEACKILCGEDPSPALLCLDLWRQRWQQVDVARDPRCTSCGARRDQHILR